MKNLLPSLSLGAILLGAVDMTAYSQTPDITGLGTGSVRDPASFSGTVCFQFSLNSSETLDDLGVLDESQTARVEVGLFAASSTDTGDLLASVDVPVLGTGIDTGKFDYVPLTLADFSNGFYWHP